MRYEISSGNSPAECELAVTKLAEYLVKNYDVKIVNSSDGYNNGTHRSITVSAENDLSEFVGTVLWVCKSPYRPNHKRKNWLLILKRPAKSKLLNLICKKLHFQHFIQAAMEVRM